MSTTVQNLIDFAQTFIQYSPISVGTGNQPAIGLANELQNTVMNPPFTWPWNRKEDTSITTTKGTADYTASITDFGFLEKVTLTDGSGNTYEIKDVYNNLARVTGSTSQEARPQAACVVKVTYGTSVTIRFIGVPDQAYTVVLTYQKLVAPLTALTGGSGTLVVPDQFVDVFNNLFLGEAMALVDDARANVYRQRGVAALLSKAEGLTQLQINAFLEQYWQRDAQMHYRMTQAQQGAQARAV